MKAKAAKKAAKKLKRKLKEEEAMAAAEIKEKPPGKDASLWSQPEPNHGFPEGTGSPPAKIPKLVIPKVKIKTPPPPESAQAPSSLKLSIIIKSPLKSPPKGNLEGVQECAPLKRWFAGGISPVSTTSSPPPTPGAPFRPKER